jgi:hypothetical protein
MTTGDAPDDNGRRPAASVAIIPDSHVTEWRGAHEGENEAMKRLQLWTVALVTVGAVAVTGCGSSSSKSAATTAAPTTAAPTTAGPTTTIDQVAAKTQITANWSKFFNGMDSDITGKLALLENAAKIGDSYKQTVAKNAASEGETSTSVSSVAFLATSDCNDALGENVPCAKVTYDLLLKGVAALKAQIGYAVFIDGTWKVSQVTECALGHLGGVDCPA